MSGPIPAGSPSVSAKGGGISLALLVLEHRAATYLLQVLLGSLLVALGHETLLGLALARGVVGRRLLLGANRKHLDAELGDFRRRQAPDFDTLENFAQLSRNVGRAANDLLAHGDVLQCAGEGDALLAALKASAQGLRFALAPIDERIRRPRRYEEKDRTHRVVGAHTTRP